MGVMEEEIQESRRMMRTLLIGQSRSNEMLLDIARRSVNPSDARQYRSEGPGAVSK